MQFHSNVYNICFKCERYSDHTRAKNEIFEHGQLINLHSKVEKSEMDSIPNMGFDKNRKKGGIFINSDASYASRWSCIELQSGLQVRNMNLTRLLCCYGAMFCGKTMCKTRRWGIDEREEEEEDLSAVATLVETSSVQANCSAETTTFLPLFSICSSKATQRNAKGAICAVQMQGL